ncbi:MFS transporter [Planosporangium sp. 12N6]|uniref:MFS transporter n=1 Tax=Planosporangium spinosum TaxID=3402278 RepID=UPI003CF15093
MWRLFSGHADFRRLWLGSTVSQFGTQVSMLAIPLLAVVTLDATTFQVGALTAAETAAFVLVGLPAGAVVDRLRRRPVLIAGDLLRVGLVASLPVAALWHVLTLGQLYVTVFAIGLCTVFFDVAYQSYLPFLVGRAHLVEANGALEASRSTAYTAGPAVAGYLVQLLSAPLALLVDAASFAGSAAWIAAVRGREPIPPATRRRALGGEIADGLRVVLGHPVLRAMALHGASSVLFLSQVRALEVVFLVRDVRLSPAAIGALFSLTGVGTVLGAVAAAPLARRFGSARVLLGAPLIGYACLLLVPLTAAGPRLACYAVGGAVSSLCVVVFNVVSISVRQDLCPDHLLGRMNATMRFFVWGTLPLGGLLAGALGSAVGLRAALWIGAVGTLLSAGWLVASPIRRTRDLTGAAALSRLGG